MPIYTNAMSNQALGMKMSPNQIPLELQMQWVQTGPNIINRHLLDQIQR